MNIQINIYSFTHTHTKIIFKVDSWSLDLKYAYQFNITNIFANNDYF